MLPRQHRLGRTRDIQLVYTTGTKSFHRLLRCYVLPSDSTRATVVVSKRVHLHAVVRNRLKRRLRSALQSLLGQITTPHDIVVVAQAKAIRADAAALTAALKYLFQQQRLL